MLGNDGAAAEQWELSDHPLTFGRGALVDVKVEDESLSRRHFMIARRGEEYFVTDLSSRNGTWVHGHRMPTAILRHNDCFQAGRTLFRFREDRPAVNVTAQPRSGPHGTEILQPPLAHAA
jgi:pSer/pThr/pTyr-binding forkhead associated (FHA) protein